MHWLELVALIIMHHITSTDDQYCPSDYLTYQILTWANKLQKSFNDNGRRKLIKDTWLRAVDDDDS